MGKTIIALFLVCILAGSGCSSLRNPYVPPDLPPAESAMIEGKVFFFSLALIHFGRRVNIVGVDDKEVKDPTFIFSFRQHIRLSPGRHTVKLTYWEKSTGHDTVSTSIASCTFDAEAGHRYQARAHELPGDQLRYEIIDVASRQPVPLI